MKKNIPLDILEKWLKGWALSRELPLPIKYKSGYMIDVGYENQKKRYVFTEPNNDYIQLSKSIDEPWVYLKACTAPDKLKSMLSKKWVIEPQGYMMSCSTQMSFSNRNLSDDYKFEFDNYNSTFVIRIVTKNGELTSIGRVVLVDDLAIYDRISTEENHRRKGLGTILMKELEKIALANNVSNNFLVATEEGKSLYLSLGWEIYSLYSSAVIID
ncbi:GNAT family N-acetyltransferase [Flavobacterium sp. F-65]|uniref:GNAT family N-acetyltransferase n=1 Tax=Flavobacterium pisciphilum TaxID=2893755 RepID=A0ABS8MPE5_9FLAO|nr:GNAT family N-acetyltransferase [Flavobacterium sp. F-65]MCC9070639.1 GNAT family N-acetyltransferase [Flavobacterium sp. F-65]